MITLYTVYINLNVNIHININIYNRNIIWTTTHAYHPTMPIFSKGWCPPGWTTWRGWICQNCCLYLRSRGGTTWGEAENQGRCDA